MVWERATKKIDNPFANIHGNLLDYGFAKFRCGLRCLFAGGAS